MTKLKTIKGIVVVKSINRRVDRIFTPPKEDYGGVFGDFQLKEKTKKVKSRLLTLTEFV